MLNQTYNRRMLFAMSNAVPNTVSAFSRSDEGALTFLGSFLTGGDGTGEATVDPLGSQGSVIASKDGRLLFCVNAGSNTISSFRIDDAGLTLIDEVFSHGVMPVSLALAGSMLYVANAGNGEYSAGIAGFCVSRYGHMRYIRGSARPLSAQDAAPGCIVFDRCGESIAVTQRGTDRIDIFEMEGTDTPGDAIPNLSNGMVPFGAAFMRKSYLRRNLLLVAEAGTNAVSSYALGKFGALYTISGSVVNGQTGTCWLASTPDGRYAYTSNAGSNNLSQYWVREDGTLELLDNTFSVITAPIDIGIDRVGERLYALSGQSGSIAGFIIQADGMLELFEVYTNTALPGPGAQGIAVL